ncbi:hypothetical protein E2C01_040520 [Portunus trituberculatus]|uniref:Uncharacterized protein n=1 Tax=Portunus trituberculatus TaxID=210409 RepID=A0A5B7FR05_PORTR|nr:hypothetical protein [Portunus trituberculatus]
MSCMTLNKHGECKGSPSITWRTEGSNTSTVHQLIVCKINRELEQSRTPRWLGQALAGATDKFAVNRATNLPSQQERAHTRDREERYQRLHQFCQVSNLEI